MLVTALLQYHQKAILVTSSASLTGLGRFPSAHIREELNRNKTETATAPASITCWALCRSQGGMKGPPLAQYVSSVSVMRCEERSTAAANQVAQVAQSRRRVTVANEPLFAP